jgi:putative pyruvate formate lyase activating enzyme
VSILGEGTAWTLEELASAMLQLQAQGSHNINFVTPTHYVPQIVRSLEIAAERGLSVPLVYNCGGYESVQVLELLEGIIDIYMPDIKFMDAGLSARYCNAPDYPEKVAEAVREMYRQVGDLDIDNSGVAQRGLLIRHLVMPGMIENTKSVLAFINEKISSDSFVNIMAQYRPCYQSSLHGDLARLITGGEYLDALAYARSIGLRRAGGH